MPYVRPQLDSLPHVSAVLHSVSSHGDGRLTRIPPTEFGILPADDGSCFDCTAKGVPWMHTPCYQCGSECGHAYCKPCEGWEGPQSPPPCAEECKAVLWDAYVEACRHAGVPVPDAHITHVAPLMPTLYEDVNLRCPHGVLWHMQPTSEQIAEWVRDGVE